MKNFSEVQAVRKDVIDAAIEAYTHDLAQQDDAGIGRHGHIANEVYASILRRGGKRIRGSLVINGYEMYGGVDAAMVLDAAKAVEMMHAYILIIDDIQDRSDVRRSGPTAHRMLEAVSRQNNWRGDHKHTGVSLALNAALIGAHEAQTIMGSLEVDEAKRLTALHLMNSGMVTTAHGQTGDIINEVNGAVTYKDVDTVLLQKTAHYTILTPLQIGMTLAGANTEDLELVTAYALEVGRAFQIVDDLLLFSENGDKHPEQDIKEGKITLLTCYALEHTQSADHDFLRSQLGNQALTSEEFNHCKTIIIASGAKQYAEEQALKALDRANEQCATFPQSWNQKNVEFLKGLSEFLAERIS